jgi:excisionase family DNA binding protein
MIKPRRIVRRSGNDRRSGMDRRQKLTVVNSAHENIYNTAEACDYLRISRPTYLKYIAEGRIRARKVGRGWKVFRSELDRFLKGE